MRTDLTSDNLKDLVENLNFAEKVERSLELIREAHREYGDRLVVANSLGKDSVAVWHLAQRVNPNIKGFIITTRHKPAETVAFMHHEAARYPNLKIFRSDEPIPDDLYLTQPDRCCDVLKVEPTRRAIDEMNVDCWV